MDGATPDISDATLQASPHGQLKKIAITMGMGRGRPRETKEDTVRWVRARRDQPVTAMEPVSMEMKRVSNPRRPLTYLQSNR